MTINLNTLTIKKAHDAFLKGEYGAVDLATAYLEAIKSKNKELNIFLEVYDDVLSQAKEADKRIKEGKATILTGIPLALKDNILVKGKRASASSKILENYVASYDSTAALKLKEAGAVLIGRTNMDEFAMGSSTETSAYGPTKNPLDTSRVPGGSSGGAAAAVAAGMVLGSLGSDTAGSVRQPASFCGAVGFKPTYGAVSRHGLMAMGSSLDVIGPIGKTVGDTEAIFNVIKGRDRMDSTSVDIISRSERLSRPRLRVADLTKFIESIGKGGIDPKIMENYKNSLDKLSKLGYEIKEPKVDLTMLKYSLPAYYIIIPAEVSTNLSRFDGVKYGLWKSGDDLLGDYKKTRAEGFGKEARRRILLGAYVLSSGYYDSYYNKAMAIRGVIEKVFDDVFEEVDFVATPTTPTPAFKIGEKTSNPVEMYLADIFTVIANIGGIPAISLPSGFVEVSGNSKNNSDKVKLPLGFQLMAPRGEDNLLFKAGSDFLRE
jgi:aspartyl-tRNA(Asn)/glutamyl-tRNA(Gln) amidotransferase subunit A